MKLSISNIGFDAKDTQKVYELLYKYNYAGLEIAPSIFVGENPYDKNEIAKQKAKQLKDDYSLEIASMQSIWFMQNGNIFNVDDVQKLVDYTKKAIIFAKDISCKNLVFGCPKNRVMPSDKSENDAISFFETVAKFARENKTAIALEANPVIYGTNFCNTSFQAFNFIEKVQYLKMNYDFSTFLYNDENLQILSDNILKVNHVHISEVELVAISSTAERRKMHRELAMLLKQNNYNKFVSIEMKKCEIEQVEKILYQIAEDFS